MQVSFSSQKLAKFNQQSDSTRLLKLHTYEEVFVNLSNNKTNPNRLKAIGIR